MLPILSMVGAVKNTLAQQELNQSQFGVHKLKVLSKTLTGTCQFANDLAQGWLEICMCQLTLKVNQISQNLSNFLPYSTSNTKFAYALAYHCFSFN